MESHHTRAARSLPLAGLRPDPQVAGFVGDPGVRRFVLEEAQVQQLARLSAD